MPADAVMVDAMLEAGAKLEEFDAPEVERVGSGFEGVDKGGHYCGIRAYTWEHLVWLMDWSRSRGSNLPVYGNTYEEVLP